MGATQDHVERPLLALRAVVLGAGARLKAALEAAGGLQLQPREQGGSVHTQGPGNATGGGPPVTTVMTCLKPWRLLCLPHSVGPVLLAILEVESCTQITWGSDIYLTHWSWQTTFLCVSSAGKKKERERERDRKGSDYR